MKSRLILASAILLSIAAAAGGWDRSTGAQAKGPHAGTTIRVLAANHPWTEAAKPLLRDFEAKTGIKVNLESYGEDQLTQKLTTEFTARTSRAAPARRALTPGPAPGARICGVNRRAGVTAHACLRAWS